MKELIFATTNPGKTVSLQARLDRDGCDITVVAKPLDITEVRADIPDGHSTTLSQLSQEERHKINDKRDLIGI